MRDKQNDNGIPMSLDAPFRNPTLKGLGVIAPESDPGHEDMTEVISGPVRSYTSRITAMKQVPITEVFNALHPDVRRDLARLCDFADNPFEFEQQFREFCETNPLFLAQTSILLEKRTVRARITTFQPVEDGWCVEDRLDKVFNPSVRDDISLHISKTSGDFSQYPPGTVKKVPLRNILPHNLKDNSK